MSIFSLLSWNTKQILSSLLDFKFATNIHNQKKIVSVFHLAHGPKGDGKRLSSTLASACALGHELFHLSGTESTFLVSGNFLLLFHCQVNDS
jgi:hypothetical protein